MPLPGPCYRLAFSIMESYHSVSMMSNIVKTCKLEDAVVLESEIKRTFPPCFANEYYKLDEFGHTMLIYNLIYKCRSIKKLIAKV